MSSLELYFGALAPSFANQIKEAGFVADAAGIELCQRDAEAIDRLRIRGLLSDSVSSQCRKKLMKHIMRYVKVKP